MNTDTPLQLIKANAELQMRLSRLLQESGQQWLEQANRGSSEVAAETGAALESLLKTSNWQELATLPAQAYWRQIQQQTSNSQALYQAAIAIQTNFTKGLQQAVQEWQSSVTSTIGTGDATAPLRDLFTQWGSAWKTATKPVETSKGSGRHAG